MAPKIPDRWLNYKAIGKRIEGTRFIAFKVPLKQHLIEDVKKDVRLDGNMLLETVPNLGVIIDLTNTNRYYDPGFFQAEGVDHIKIMIPGHVTPPQRLVDRFKDFVKKFIQNNPDNDKLIGVHCTHGVNRTGFLICNYMVSEMAVKPTEAIDKFAEARGHKIERGNYLDALHKLTAAAEGEAERDRESSRSPERVPPTTQNNHRRAHINSDRGRMSHDNRRFENRMRSRSPLNQNIRDRFSWRRPENGNHNERHQASSLPRSRSPANQHTRDRYNRPMGINSNYNERGPPRAPRGRPGHANNYYQQCRSEGYAFQEMEFRSRSRTTNNPQWQPPLPPAPAAAPPPPYREGAPTWGPTRHRDHNRNHSNSSHPYRSDTRRPPSPPAQGHNPNYRNRR